MSVEQTAANIRRHRDICRSLGSELYATLFDAAAGDLERGGPVRTVLARELDATFESAMPLRFMAAVHRLVLTGRAPELAAYYPSAGGSRPVGEAWPAFAAALEANEDELPSLIARPCQTNEVGRSAGLVLGFLEIARASGLPVRLLELGTSGGLNLRWDRFRYESREAAWGPADSPVRLVDRWDRTPEVFDPGPEVSVAERRGCDPNPVDPTTDEGRLTLMSSVWADQVERFKLLEGAIQIAREVPAEIDQAKAEPWLEGQLAEVAGGISTVVFHSVVMQYLSGDERAAVETTIREAGARATPGAPLAWCRMEPRDVAKLHEVRLTVWPRGEERLLALSAPHGARVDLVGA